MYMFCGLSLVALSLVATSTLAAGPCDIYNAGGTPCVAAHSTTRALYDSFLGALYEVKRGSDGKTTTIAPLSAGGVANAAAQDSFCAKTTCVITVIYDQSGRGNHLTQALHGRFKGPEVNHSDNVASAIGAPVTLGGHKAYGVFISPGTGYRNDAAKGTATHDEPQGIYAVLDGTHYNSRCCFDYGNAETNNHDTGSGHMEAIYFGDSTYWGFGSGKGPWIMADLENGLFSGYSKTSNLADPSISYRFVTAAVKGTAGLWAIRGADAVTSSTLTTYYSGARPAPRGYNPMSKEGAIVLGIGGDNSNGGQGTFYEGVMTHGYPSDATEDAVQANIRAAGYATVPPTHDPDLKVGGSYSLRATTAGYENLFLTHIKDKVKIQLVTSSSSLEQKKQASWTVVPGLGNSACISFESSDKPGSYIRHWNFALQVNANDGSKRFSEDSTFCPFEALNGKGKSFFAWAYPTRHIRHYKQVGYAASNGGVHKFDMTEWFNDDVSWAVEKSFI